MCVCVCVCRNVTLMPLNDIFRRTIEMFKLTVFRKTSIMGSVQGYLPPIRSWRVLDKDKLDLMYLCVKMSLHAYEDEWRIQRFLNTYRLRLKKWNMAANVNLPAFFIAEDPYNGTLYISVRGTQHVNDVFTSFQTNVTRLQVYRNHSHVLVHAGFLHSAKCILEKEIAPVLQRNPNRNIILTGHSLGGAVATLLTVLLVRGRETAYPYKSLRAVTYGAPPSVASNLHLPELLSVSMEGDLVPRLSMQNAMLIRDFYLNTSCPSNHFDQTPPLDALLVPGTIYWVNRHLSAHSEDTCCWSYVRHHTICYFVNDPIYITLLIFLFSLFCYSSKHHLDMQKLPLPHVLDLPGGWNKRNLPSQTWWGFCKNCGPSGT